MSWKLSSCKRQECGYYVSGTAGSCSPGEKSLSSQTAGQLLQEDEEFVRAFKGNSAAKTVHHGFIGGLLEHTLSVVKLCQYYCRTYPILNQDLLITTAMLHDIGKNKGAESFSKKRLYR